MLAQMLRGKSIGLTHLVEQPIAPLLFHWNENRCFPPSIPLFGEVKLILKVALTGRQEQRLNYHLIEPQHLFQWVLRSRVF